MDNIDFVVTWLDANDPVWRGEYNKYRGDVVHKEDNGRYRNWDFFKYWFRAVEKYAPWVNKVYLVTNGKNPDWINPNHPKLVLVKHSDFMPERYLPTFNSCAIEINFNHIKGLSEYFVYFNDDCFINSPVSPMYYFKNGLPCDCNEESIFLRPSWDPRNKFSNKIQRYCDVAILNNFFNRKNVVRSAFKNWLGLHLGIEGFLTSIIMMHSPMFESFRIRHYEQPMLKSVINDIWEKAGEMAEITCSRFRQDVSLNPYIIRYWQFASNRFSPMKLNEGRLFTLGRDDTNTIVNALQGNRYKSICLNDTPFCSEEDYLKVKMIILNVFEKKFPNKSNYEL